MQNNASHFLIRVKICIQVKSSDRNSHGLTENCQPPSVDANVFKGGQREAKKPSNSPHVCFFTKIPFHQESNFQRLSKRKEPERPSPNTHGDDTDGFVWPRTA